MKKTVPLPKMLEKAQKVFNKHIRTRDKDSGCICCGGSVDHAGHYFSQGQFSALRYDETNVHGCCIGCNTYKHGNLIMYRIGMVRKYGEDYVKDLESRAMVQKVYKWSRTELEEIIKKYNV